MITARPSISMQATLFRRSPSPATSDRSVPVTVTKLPSIQRMLHPDTRPEVLQRPRGSTLPSYASPTAGQNGSSAIEPVNRINRKERSSTISGRPHEDYSHARAQHPSSPPVPGTLLPPIRMGNRSPPSPTFRGLPSIQTMLPVSSTLRSMDSRSPVSPPSPQSMVQSSSSWSSNANTSNSSADVTGRFHHLPPLYDVQYHRRASPISSYSPPPSQYEEEDAISRSREMVDDPDTGYTIQRRIQPNSSGSSLLSTSASRLPNASTIPRLNVEREYGSDSYSKISRSRLAIPEDVAITSSSIIFPSSAPSAGRQTGSLPPADSPERSFHFDASSQQGRHSGYEGMVVGAFDASESDGGRPRPGETSGGKKRRSRATQEQLDILNGVYARTPFPTTVERAELAQQLGMTPRSVQIWFQNKRQGAKNNESRRREQPPLISTHSNSPQMPNLVPLSLAPPLAMSQSPPSPSSLDARSMSYGVDRRDSFESNGIRGRARRRRMSVNDLLSHDGRDEGRAGVTTPRHGGRQRIDEREL